MTPTPKDEAEDREDPVGAPLENEDAGRQVAHLTGFSAEAAARFAGYHSGRFAPFHRAA